MGLLRALLAFSVLAWHVRPFGYNRLVFIDGGLAVIAFFIISGFYMSMVVNEKYSKFPDGNRRFLKNRVLRIFPLYLVTILLQLAMFAYNGNDSIFTSDMGYSTLTHYSLIFMNVFKFGQDYWQTFIEAFQANKEVGRIDFIETYLTNIFGKDAFAYRDGVLLVGQGWSLASELTYYLVAPLIAVSAWYWISAAGLLSVAIRLAFFWTLGSAYMGSWRTKFFPSIFIFFVLGHFSYRIYLKIKTWSQAPAIGSFVAFAWVALLIVGMSTKGLFVGMEYDSLDNWLFYFWLMLSIPFLFYKTRKSELDNFIGEFSYPIYLIHPLTIQATFNYYQFSRGIRYMLLVTGTLLLSYFLILLVERPVNRMRARISS